jgi:hypothetical protein
MEGLTGWKKEEASAPNVLQCIQGLTGNHLIYVKVR